VTHGCFKVIFEHDKSPINHISDEKRNGKQNMPPVPEVSANFSPNFYDFVELLVEIAVDGKVFVVHGDAL
jgi:hypothetical protein